MMYEIYGMEELLIKETIVIYKKDFEKKKSKAIAGQFRK